MDVKVNSKKAEKIQKYVDEGRFESVEAFVDKAVTLLLYAEDNRDLFQKMIKKQKQE